MKPTHTPLERVSNPRPVWRDTAQTGQSRWFLLFLNCCQLAGAAHSSSARKQDAKGTVFEGRTDWCFCSGQNNWFLSFHHLCFHSRMFNTTLSLNTSHMNSTCPAGLRRLPPWYQYPLCAVAPYGFVFYYGVKVFNLAVGTACNFLVIWQIATKKSDTSTSDIFIFNLAILDAYFCLMTPIEIVNHLLLDDSQIWYFQRFAYGVKDLAVLFLVSLIFTVQKEIPPTN